MNMIHYDPWRKLQQLQREMGTLFDPLLGTTDESATIATSEWVPAVDIKEEDSQFLVVADIPGVAPEDIEVKIENGTLSIKGERSEEHKEEKEGYQRIERSCGTFHRRFTLPETADPEGITAKSNNGSLEVVIPKREAPAQSRRINVEH